MERRLKDHLQLYFQPQINPVTNVIMGAEVLSRLDDGCGNLMLPKAFIPQLEKGDGIITLDCLVIKRLLKCLGQWKDQGYPTIPLSINLSRKTLMSPRFSEVLMAELAQSGISQEEITLEIVEYPSGYSTAPIKAVVENLVDQGIRFSMDDFGTEYSNLMLLSKVAFSEVKLDKSLIDGLGSTGREEIICQSIISMCHQMDITVVAEGVETMAQRDHLAQSGCDLLQGFFYSKAISQQDFEALLQDRPKDNLQFQGVKARP